MIEELEKKEKEEANNEDESAAPAIVMKGAMTKEEIKEQESKEVELEEEPEEEKSTEEKGDAPETHIYAVRTTANREDQVMDFISSNADRKGLDVFSVIRPHGMRGYIFVEAADRSSAEQAAFGIPYARGLLPNIVNYSEIEHMLEQVKKEINIQKNDIAEIISGPFKREKCKITRVDKQKAEVVVELLEAAVPIPITVKIDAVKVIRREDGEE
ncbi:transcription elongation factor Spt5 [Bacteroidota bacterium]